MKKSDKTYKAISLVLVLLLLALTGCSSVRQTEELQQQGNMQLAESHSSEKASQTKETLTDGAPEEEVSQTSAGEAGTATEEVQGKTAEPIVTEADWSDYFGTVNGAAVIYDTMENTYQIYNRDLAFSQRSPCSTFKIISSLIALENGILIPENSVRVWSGEQFWNEGWNRDIDFSDAFHTSCVWYFREVVDEIGKDLMQRELDRLGYGNCDISDWEGRLNTNNNNPALTGFWIESSLLISPKEQTEVMERIFGGNTVYSEETLHQLEQVMLLPDKDVSDVSIYGKTGMGKARGIVVDAWFTGFAENGDKRIYFCVYLGETDNCDVSSARAKEIAVKLVSSYLDRTA